MLLFLGEGKLAQDWLNAHHLINSLVYTGIGLMAFAVAFVIMSKAIPFSVRKEIEEDQNTALGIIMGSVILGLAIIIAAAVHGG
ncbi:MAG: DUF350 domain-containing protein [Planctomycetes bacterium]|nr:DUF350 domain-containing protein [Planctomycetota bacterium]